MNLVTNSGTASGAQHWKASKITLRCFDKGMNLDRKMATIPFEEVRLKKEVVVDLSSQITLIIQIGDYTRIRKCINT